MRRLIGVVALLILVGTAGCAGLTGPSDTTDTTAQVYISDAPIDNFESLNVTITAVGVTTENVTLDVEQDGEGDLDAEIEAAYEHDYEDGAWTNATIDERTVDLTELTGDRAIRLTNLTIPPGQYGAAYVEIEDVNGTLANSTASPAFEEEDGRILLSKPFTVSDNGTTKFVFDMTAAQTEDEYVLLPNALASGADRPLIDVEHEGENMRLAFQGNVTPGQNATLLVTDRAGTPLDNATVQVNDELVGQTDANGTITITVPVAEEMEVEVEHSTGEGEIEYDFGDRYEEPEDDDEDDDEEDDEDDTEESEDDDNDDNETT